MANHLPEDLIGGIHLYQGQDYSHEITIAQLLAHTSGLPDYYEDRAADGKSLSEWLVADPGRPWTVDATIARARDQMAPHFPPGTAAYYADTNYQLLGKIIESVTGKPLEVVLDEFFFRPLGMTHTWLVGRSQPLVPPTAAIADVFAGDVNISAARANSAFWADGG